MMTSLKDENANDKNQPMDEAELTRNRGKYGDGHMRRSISAMRKTRHVLARQ